MISQKELAKRLRLSQATVSKALRQGSDINSETRARVLRELSELGFPQQAESVRFLGALFAAQPILPSGQGRVLYFDGMSEAAKARGITLVMHQSDADGMELLDEHAWPVAMREGLVGGLALIYHFAPEVVRALARRFAVVTLTHEVAGAPCDHVDSDHVNGMDRLVGHLAELGHRRIGFLMHSDVNTFGRARYRSMAGAMAARELGAPAKCWIGNGYNEDSHKEATRVIVAGLAEGITAWMGDSDRLMEAVSVYLLEAGVRIPEQVSLTGYDHLPTIPNARPLTTVRIDGQAMGREAIRLLMRRLDEPESLPLRVLVDTPLVIGDTTGPAPRS